MNDRMKKALATALFFFSAASALFAPSAKAQEDREAVRKSFEAVRPSFCTLEFTLRKKTRLEKSEIEEESPDSEIQRLVTLADNQQTLDAWGVAVTKDEILLPELFLRPGDVEKLEVTDASGARFEGRLHAVGRDHDFVIVKPAAPRELVPLAFAEWTRPELGEYFHVTYADLVDNRWNLNVSPYIQTNAPLLPQKDWFCTDSLRAGSVVADRKGVPVGIALDQYLWVRADGRSSFLGRAILADERISDLEARYETLRKAAAGAVRRIEITFRADRADELGRGADPRAGRAVLFGLVLDDKGTLLVPQELSRDQVRKIEDIRIGEGAQRHAGAFVGSFRAIGGMLIRAEGLKAQPAVARDAAPPPPGQLFFTATFDDRFGRSRVKVDYNRLFRVEKGLKGAARLQPRKKTRPGSFLLDFDGRVVGVVTGDRKDEDLDEMALEQSRERFYMERYRALYAPDYLRRILFFSEIGDVLSDPAAHFDPRAVPMTKKEEKRLVWLGVEFQELSKPLAEALGVQERDLTNDGRRGLFVTEIHPGSPAEIAGLRSEDILLTLQPEGEASRDLAAEPIERFGGFGRGQRAGGVTGQTPWKPTRNYLTSMLTEVGADRTVAFEYLRGGKKARVEIKLAYAPTDFETADRFKDDALGFTVKELTYEVRHFQKLDPAFKGVVVAKVESGSKADVAKLPPLSIIWKVNDDPVRDLGHFKELVATARSLTLTTISYGQTKLVEIERE
jgi:hypothetical protein